eukprot:8991533-Alexandrium_andersonii.AAC.1
MLNLTIAIATSPSSPHHRLATTTIAIATTIPIAIAISISKHLQGPVQGSVGSSSRATGTSRAGP